MGDMSVLLGQFILYLLVASLAQPLRIVRPVYVRAESGTLGAALIYVANLAHELSSVRQFQMIALINTVHFFQYFFEE